MKNLSDITIRNALRNDLEAINNIYNYYVLNSTSTYQTEIEPIEKREEWFIEHEGKYPIIVAEKDDNIIGWASVSMFHKRCAYRFTVEDSVYVEKNWQGKGIGSLLLKNIIRVSAENNFHSIIAIISDDQIASIKLHEKFGFVKSGHLKEVGYKFDKYLGVLYYQLILK